MAVVRTCAVIIPATPPPTLAAAVNEQLLLRWSLIIGGWARIAMALFARGASAHTRAGAAPMSS